MEQMFKAIFGSIFTAASVLTESLKAVNNLACAARERTHIIYLSSEDEAALKILESEGNFAVRLAEIREAQTDLPEDIRAEAAQARADYRERKAAERRLHVPTPPSTEKKKAK